MVRMLLENTSGGGLREKITAWEYRNDRKQSRVIETGSRVIETELLRRYRGANSCGKVKTLLERRFYHEEKRENIERKDTIECNKDDTSEHNKHDRKNVDVTQEKCDVKKDHETKKEIMGEVLPGNEGIKHYNTEITRNENLPMKSISSSISSSESEDNSFAADNNRNTQKGYQDFINDYDQFKNSIPSYFIDDVATDVRQRRRKKSLSRENSFESLSIKSSNDHEKFKQISSDEHQVITNESMKYTIIPRKEEQTDLLKQNPFAELSGKRFTARRATLDCRRVVSFNTPPRRPFVSLRNRPHSFSCATATMTNLRKISEESQTEVLLHQLNNNDDSLYPTSFDNSPKKIKIIVETESTEETDDKYTVNRQLTRKNFANISVIRRCSAPAVLDADEFLNMKYPTSNMTSWKNRRRNSSVDGSTLNIRSKLQESFNIEAQSFDDSGIDIHRDFHSQLDISSSFEPIVKQSVEKKVRKKSPLAPIKRIQQRLKMGGDLASPETHVRKHSCPMSFEEAMSKSRTKGTDEEVVRKTSTASEDSFVSSSQTLPKPQTKQRRTSLQAIFTRPLTSPPRRKNNNHIDQNNNFTRDFAIKKTSKWDILKRYKKKEKTDLDYCYSPGERRKNSESSMDSSFSCSRRIRSESTSTTSYDSIEDDTHRHTKEAPSFDVWAEGKTRIGLKKDSLPLLHVAASEGNIELINILTDVGVDINERDADGWPALHYAVCSGQFAAARLLVERGACIAAYSARVMNTYCASVRNCIQLA